MKRIVKTFGIILLLLLGVLITTPLIFKNDIVNLVKKEINMALDAEVSFGDFSLSLLKSFPDFHLSIEDISIVGIDEFNGIELASIKEIAVVVDVMSVVTGNTILVERIELVQPSIHAKVMADGQANYFIVREDTVSTEEANRSEPTAFSLALQELEITGAGILYEDATLPVHFSADELDLTLSGDFTESVTNLDVEGEIAALDLNFEGIQYISKAKVLLDAVINMNLDEMKFTFKDNEIKINELPLGFDGWLAMPNEPIDMNLSFHANRADIKSIFSMIPAVFTQDLNGLETVGNLSLTGFAKGTFIDTIYPSFGLELAVEDGSIHYPDLPQSITDIQVRGSVMNKDGNLNSTIIDFPIFHLKMGENPFDVSFYSATPLSNPYIRAGLAGEIILDNLKELMPLSEGDELSGTFSGNLALEGNLSTIEKEAYEDFKAEGSIKGNSIHYKSSLFAYPINLNEIELVFSPQYLALNKMSLELGESDIKAEGQVENYIGYVLRANEILKGKLALNSTYLNVNELMQTEEDSTSFVGEDSSSMQVVVLPKNINFNTTATIEKLLYDELVIEKITGGIAFNQQKMKLTKTSMNLLEGNMTMNGFYETTDSLSPQFNFEMSIDDFDLQESIQHFNTVNQLAPLAKYGRGKYSTTMNISGVLNQYMEPLYQSINGKGRLNTKSIAIEGYKPLVKIAEILKYDKVNPLQIKDTKLKFEIIEGKVFIEPFTNKIGNTSLTISGSNSFDQTIDYLFSFAIPREEFGGKANAVLDGLLVKAASTGVDLSKTVDVINVDVTLKGPAAAPKIGTGFKKATSNAKTAIKQKAKAEIEAAKQKAKEEIEKKKKELEEQAKQELQKQKQKAIKELERQKQKAKEELEKQKEEAKEKLKDQAKDKLKDFFKKK